MLGEIRPQFIRGGAQIAFAAVVVVGRGFNIARTFSDVLSSGGNDAAGSLWSGSWSSKAMQ